MNETARIAEIREILPTLPEYASLKSIPNLPQLVLTDLQSAQRAAAEQGDGEASVSVAQVVKSLHQTFVSALKNHLGNAELAKEVGYSGSQQISRPPSNRVLTPDMAAQGSISRTDPKQSLSKTLEGQLAKALGHMSR